MTHTEMYMNLCALTRRSGRLDHSYHAAFYLLSTDPEIYRLACNYIDNDGIGFQGMKMSARHLDDRQRQVVEIAHNLFSWTSRCPVTPYNISQMELPTLEAVINAIHIAVGHAAVQVHGEQGLTISWDKFNQTKAIYAQLHRMELDVPDEPDDGMEP